MRKYLQHPNKLSAALATLCCYIAALGGGARRHHVHGFATTVGGRLSSTTTTTTTTTTTKISWVRLHATQTPKYVRWQQTPQGWAMQTAVTTFESQQKDRLELHAQLHFGDASYFDYYNSKQFNQERTVLYELLVDESLLLTFDDPKQQRTVARPLSASPVDQQMAQQYGWTCQVDAIHYDQSNWIHADLSRQEFMTLAGNNQQQQQKQQPLWQLASSNNNPLVVPSAAAEAATALLVGPPILEPEFAQRRLFSNLFLPGNALAQALRAILWFTVPSPELSILLLDWSSLLVSRVAGLSQITSPLLQALASARLDQVRRLVFGQVIVTGSQIHSATGGGNGRAYDLLIQRRNDKALSVLSQVQQQDKIALLYGCSHCPDLHQKLQALGYTPRKTEWRTAWTVDTSSKTEESAARATAMGLLVLLPLYFAIGGLDWMSTLGDLAQETDRPVEFSISALLYLARHVLLYVGLSKVLLDWEAKDEDEIAGTTTTTDMI